MPEHPLLHGIESLVRRYGLIAREEQVILAVSGGIDSIVLLEAMNELKSRYHIELVVAHFNHQMRGSESDQDEEFVRMQATKYGVQCYVEKANTKALSEVNKRSIQETARDLRYRFFTRLRTSLGFQKIATAHHANDNAETILFNLFRGAGIHGLAGIPVFRKDISVIRPLLFATREEISGFAQGRGLVFREDSSNAQSEYTRNFLRHKLIPLVRENINPNLIGTLRRTSEIFEEIERYILSEVETTVPKIILNKVENEIRMNLTALQNVPVLLQEYVLQHIAGEFTETEIDFNVVLGMLAVARSTTGASMQLPKNAACYRNRDELILTKHRRMNSFRYYVRLNEEYDFEYIHFNSSTVPRADFTADPNIEYVDGTALGTEITLRTWNDGDTFIPLGMKESKKVSDFFIDEKIPLFEKHSIPILVSDNQIVWICGKRLDDRYKVVPGTKTIVRLEYYPRL